MRKQPYGSLFIGLIIGQVRGLRLSARYFSAAEFGRWTRTTLDRQLFCTIYHPTP